MNTEPAEATNQISTLALFLIGSAGGLGALGAGLVSALVLFLNQRRSERLALANWERDQKFAAYSEYVHAVVNLGVRLKAERDNPDFKALPDSVETLDLQREQSRIQSKVQLLMEPSAFEDVRELMKDITVRDNDAAPKARHDLILLLRDDIRTTGRGRGRTPRTLS